MEQNTFNCALLILISLFWAYCELFCSNQIAQNIGKGFIYDPAIMSVMEPALSTLIYYMVRWKEMFHMCQYLFELVSTAWY